jgi:hypothetical protein
MKKQILMAIGVASLFTAQPSVETQAAVRVGVSVPGANFYFSDRPDFVYLRDRGYSVSYGAPYDVISYSDDYYAFRDGYWYRARDFRGPWVHVMTHDLPGPIRAHRIEDIRRFRDREYYRHDHRFWSERFRRDRDDWRRHDHYRARLDDRRGPDDRWSHDGRRGPDERRDFDGRRGPDGGRWQDR